MFKDELGQMFCEDVSGVIVGRDMCDQDIPSENLFINIMVFDANVFGVGMPDMIGC